MKEKIEQILNEVKNFQADSKEALENFRITYLSKKGVIPALFADFKNVAPELRKEMGMMLGFQQASGSVTVTKYLVGSAAATEIAANYTQAA